MAWSTADGVGMRMPERRSVTWDRPLAWTIRLRKISRILLWVGSICKTPNLGMTLGHTWTSCPARIRWHARAATRFPATTMGKAGGREASILALWRMHSRLPPSVPPTSRKMSGLAAWMSSRSSSVSSKE